MARLEAGEEIKQEFPTPHSIDHAHFYAHQKGTGFLSCLRMELLQHPSAIDQYVLQVRLNGHMLKQHDIQLQKTSGRTTCRSNLKTRNGYPSKLPDDLKNFIGEEHEGIGCTSGDTQQTSSPLQRQQRQRRRQPVGEHCLVGVVIAAVGLTADERLSLENTASAFGGSLLPEFVLDGATHIIVGPEVCSLPAQLEKTDRILSLSWLEEIIKHGSDPMDDMIACRHTPPLFRTSVFGKTPSTGSSQLKRRRLSDHEQPAYDQGTGSTLTSSCSSIRAPSKFSRSKSQQQISSSLSETLAYMRREHPNELEASQIRVAIERSLLDTAVELHRGAPHLLDEPAPLESSPALVLGVSEDAQAPEIRAAYRVKALAAHPDKGGDPAEFCRVRRAYLALSGAGCPGAAGTDRFEGSERLALPASAISMCKDFQLRNHRELVRQKFEEDGVNLENCLRRQARILKLLGLIAQDQGATNTNEDGVTIYNQCFYLSLAKSYSETTCVRSLRDTALGLKRVIEAAVLAEHADWGGERVGEDVQAFADFLVFVLGTNALLSELAVAIFDAATGGVEVYMGRQFPGRGREAEQRSNMLTLVYQPGHYKALVPESGNRPSFRELRDCLEEHEVQHVVTYV